MTGFVAPGEVIPDTDVNEQLRALTLFQTEFGIITRGTYILEEDDLPDVYKELLHGRAFVINQEYILDLSYTSPSTYYIAGDSVQGLIVPARSMFIESKNGTIKYRWTDDGDKWTAWITLETGVSDDYPAHNKNRFAEVQVYKVSGTPYINIVASR
jgi:hypothetical protein